MPPTADHPQSDFIKRAEALVIANLAEEAFGVSELADALSMSRSNLLRKIKKETELSASQFIREIRLRESAALLKQNTLSVSEVAYAVGFSSVSYYIKCFRELYGYPPGQHLQQPAQIQVSSVALKEELPSPPTNNAPMPVERPKLWWLGAGVALVAIILLSIWWFPDSDYPELDREKSIAVLPFSNESSDSSNLYFVNGLMESTLGNLQKIEGLRVVSRTSSEKYRGSRKSIREIAEDLEVAYVVEGSGQKVGDQVLLNIQLIDAQSDRPLWTEQYQRRVQDIFDLQKEIAEGIAESIKVFISPSALVQIERKPTESIEAYDYFLQGLAFLHKRGQEDLWEAIRLFTLATEQDKHFALAFANIAMSYYLLDLYQEEKQYAEEINTYADKALLHDPKSDIGLIAKAAYYLQSKQYRLALPHLEKSLEYNPNSIGALQMLADFYAFQQPNTAKYLEYALMGIQRNTANVDSVARSYLCVQLSNAFLQNGFFEEALAYVDQALLLFPDNYFAPYLRTFVRFAADGNYERTKQDLLAIHAMDTSRLDVIQDIAKIYFAQGQHDSAFYYYQILENRRKAFGLKVYMHENVKMAYLYKEQGLLQEAEELFAQYQAHVVEETTVYKEAFKAVEFAYLGEEDAAIAELRKFAGAQNIQYWFLLLAEEPLLDGLRDRAAFKEIFKELEQSFWKNHGLLETRFKAKGLLQ